MTTSKNIMKIAFSMQHFISSFLNFVDIRDEISLARFNKKL